MTKLNEFQLAEVSRTLWTFEPHGSVTMEDLRETLNARSLDESFMQMMEESLNVKFVDV